MDEIRIRENPGQITANRRESTINPSERGFGASNALWGERGTDDKVDDKCKLEQCGVSNQRAGFYPIKANRELDQ